MTRQDIPRLFLLPHALLFCWPFLLVLWALGLVEKPIWGSRPPPRPFNAPRLPWWGVLTAVRTARWTWPDAKWSWAIGPAIIWSRGIRDYMIAEVSAHEHVHVRQAEDEAVVGFSWCVVMCIAAIVGDGWLAVFGVALWLLMPAMSYANNVTSWIRGHGLYEGAQHERSARAQSVQHDFKTWQERTGADP